MYFFIIIIIIIIIVGQFIKRRNIAEVITRALKLTLISGSQISIALLIKNYIIGFLFIALLPIILLIFSLLEMYWSFGDALCKKLILPACTLLLFFMLINNTRK